MHNKLKVPRSLKGQLKDYKQRTNYRWHQSLVEVYKVYKI